MIACERMQRWRKIWLGAKYISEEGGDNLSTMVGIYFPSRARDKIANERPIFTHVLYYNSVSKGFLVLLLRDYQHVETSAFNV